MAKSLGIHGFVTEQPPYNLLDRRIEQELLPFCRTYDYGVIPWSPLAGGQLSGKYLDNKPTEARYAKSDPQHRVNEQTKAVVLRLKALADECGMSLATLSLAWVASQPGVTSPIIGARSEKQLEESAQACQTKLDADILSKIDEIVPPCSNLLDYYSANFGPNARPR